MMIRESIKVINKLFVVLLSLALPLLIAGSAPAEEEGDVLPITNLAGSIVISSNDMVYYNMVADDGSSKGIKEKLGIRDRVDVLHDVTAGGKPFMTKKRDGNGGIVFEFHLVVESEYAPLSKE